MECVSAPGSGRWGGGGGAPRTRPAAAVLGRRGHVRWRCGRPSVARHWASPARPSPPPANAMEMTDGSSWIRVPYASRMDLVLDDAPNAHVVLPQPLLAHGSRRRPHAPGGGRRGAATFGHESRASNATVPVGQGPLTTVMRRVLVHHRFVAPRFPAGPSCGQPRAMSTAITPCSVAGDGREEEFHPRARLDVTGARVVPDRGEPHSRRAVTGESFIVFPSLRTIERLVP